MALIAHHLKILLDGKPVRVIFSKIVGLDIAKYNNEMIPNSQQEELDSTINTINMEINSFNSPNDAISPWLARDIHKNARGRKKSRYYLLGDDGVHLTSEMRSKWATEILSSLHKNYDKMKENQ